VRTYYVPIIRRSCSLPVANGHFILWMGCVIFSSRSSLPYESGYKSKFWEDGWPLKSPLATPLLWCNECNADVADRTLIWSSQPHHGKHVFFNKTAPHIEVNKIQKAEKWENLIDASLNVDVIEARYSSYKIRLVITCYKGFQEFIEVSTHCKVQKNKI